MQTQINSNFGTLIKAQNQNQTQNQMMPATFPTTSSGRAEAARGQAMECVTLTSRGEATKALKLYDCDGRTGPIELGGIGLRGMVFVRVPAATAVGMLQRNPGLYSMEGEKIVESVGGLTLVDLVRLIHSGYNKTTSPHLAYYKNLFQGLDETIKLRVVIRSPLANHAAVEHFFEIDLEVHRLPLALAAAVDEDKGDNNNKRLRSGCD